METSLWVTRDDGTVTGPHGIHYLRRELGEGNLTLDHLAAQSGTEDWMPLQEWGAELYPVDGSRKGPSAQKVISSAASTQEKPPSFLPLVAGLMGFIGIIFFAVVYDSSVATEFGRVSNFSRSIERMIGLGLSAGMCILGIAIDISRRKKGDGQR